MECSTAAHNVRTEQVVPEAASQLAEPRMDICATDNEGTTLHIDLTVASPLTSSALKAGSSIKPGVAAEVLARHKLNKFRLSKLTPFAVESLATRGSL